MAREKMLRPRSQPISLRLHAGQRDRIWGLASIEGRTLNDMVCGLLDLAMMRADEGFGSYQGHVVARALLAAAEAAVVRHGADKGMWLYDPGFFELARVAMNQVLECWIRQVRLSFTSIWLSSTGASKSRSIGAGKSRSTGKPRLGRHANAMPREVRVASIRERVWTGADGIERRAWQADFVDQAGKRRHRQFQPRKDADAWLVTARGQVAAGTFTAGQHIDHGGRGGGAMARAV